MRLSFRFCANIYGPLDGERLYCNLATGSFHTKKLCSTLYSTEVEFYSKKQNISLFKPPFGDSEVTHAKPVVDFLFVIIELFFAISYG